MPENFVTNRVLMIEPISFQGNQETEKTNFYQKQTNKISPKHIQELALEEFLLLKEKLISNGIQVISVKDTLSPHTPDAIFPNNWISFHKNQKAILYPMLAENRRKERRLDILETLNSYGYSYSKIVDYAFYEAEDRFLEGTGAMVLDRKNNIAYCSLSLRAEKSLFLQFCSENKYKPITFTSYQTVNNSRKPIYHTNVMMSVGSNYAMICLDAIDDLTEKEMVRQSLKNSDKEIIALTEDQIAHFAGNTLLLRGNNSDIIVMSEQAKKSLTQKQISALEKYGKIVTSPIPTIEKFGGGSVRCMLAEIF